MKEEIIEMLASCNRDGMAHLLHWLENETDYFTAPASTKYHDSFEGGLAKHSNNVLYCLLNVLKIEQFSIFDIDRQSIIICALLHDICKTNFYKVSEKNVKDEKTGKWNKENYYTIEDSHFYGHGECSVMLIEKHIKLTDEERYAIRWHMGAWSDDKTGALNKAFKTYPLALALHMADMMASNLEIE
jgi:hypothetical protein